MDELAFWKQKIVQFLHDPPAKPFAWYPKTGGHRNVAKRLFERFTGQPHKFTAARPDWASAGADRPMLMVPKGAKGRVQVHWGTHPIVTHPLARSYLHIPKDGFADVADRYDDGDGIVRLEADERSPHDILAEQAEIVDGLSQQLDDWQSPAQLKQSFVTLWRQFRERLIADRGGRKLGDPLWEAIPGDSRCPDHSIWDHLRVTTALAFLDTKKLERLPTARQPWLLRCQLGPSQRFIAEARSSRDLWLGSFLLADLAWHAMQPVVERYGPDAIVYPDLFRNPRVDRWLYDAYPEAFPDDPEAAEAATFAAVLPNAFTAIVPRGGDRHLLDLEDLADSLRAKMAERWEELAELVKGWLKGPERVGSGDWERIWDRHHAQPPIELTWSAVAWLPPEPIAETTGLRGPALPAQSKAHRAQFEASEADREAIAAREARLRPWLDLETWAHYERAREVYAKSSLQWHQVERGFDYALTHHQLVARHGMRKAEGTDADSAAESGEKCTQCGRRQALGNYDKDRDLDSQRQQARRFWSQSALDRDKLGEDRLCGVCTMRRFLVEAGQTEGGLKGINEVWAGPNARLNELLDDDGELRVPFPSTATIAAQDYLLQLAKNPSLHSAMTAVVDAYEDAGLPRTGFARALPRLAEASNSRGQAVKRFLMLDTQNSLFSETLQARIDRSEQPHGGEQLKDLQKRINDLRKIAKDQLDIEPGTQIAVIRMDGDKMRRLLLGDRHRVGATWEEVLHPKAVEQLQKSEHLIAAGWPELLGAPRLSGPSLHAFISRVLGEFSHRIVPWVVEREFSGRLIYAGGDDLLCLAPAGEALSLAARLQQLFAAPWVIDSNYDPRPWAWRHRGWKGHTDATRDGLRFVIPRTPKDKNQPIHLPLRAEQGEVSPVTNETLEVREWPVSGPLLPMLGPKQSLSAGIAIAHYKTPLGTLLRHSGYLLDELAKDRTGPGTLAVSHYARNGAKSEITVPWAMANGTPRGQERLQRVIRAFSKGWLPRRMPYKLRADGEAVVAALKARYDSDEAGRGIGKAIDPKRLRPDRHDFEDDRDAEHIVGLMRGLVRRALDDKKNQRIDGDREPLYKPVLDLWRYGFALHGADPERAVEGLLCCRRLAAGGEEEG